MIRSAMNHFGLAISHPVRSAQMQLYPDFITLRLDPFSGGQVTLVLVAPDQEL